MAEYGAFFNTHGKTSMRQHKLHVESLEYSCVGDGAGKKPSRMPDVGPEGWSLVQCRPGSDALSI